MQPTPRRIVGVVGDIDDVHILPERTLAIYEPIAQAGLFGGRLFVRASANPYALVSPITRSIRAMSADQPIERAATLEDVKAEVLTPDRLNSLRLRRICDRCAGDRRGRCRRCPRVFRERAHPGVRYPTGHWLAVEPTAGGRRARSGGDGHGRNRRRRRTAAISWRASWAAGCSRSKRRVRCRLSPPRSSSSWQRSLPRPCRLRGSPALTCCRLCGRSKCGWATHAACQQCAH